MILLHTCCAPCAGAVIEKFLVEGEQFAVFFSNSNIAPREEYDLRLAELKRYCEPLGVTVIEDNYDHSDWLEAIRGLENEPERGGRCAACFRYRLARAAHYANSHGFHLLTTTLASSRWKNLDQVNSAGSQACEAEAVGIDRNSSGACQFWAANWRKGGLQERRNAIIKEQGFYNQNWCGCEFSRRD